MYWEVQCTCFYNYCVIFTLYNIYICTCTLQYKVSEQYLHCGCHGDPYPLGLSVCHVQHSALSHRQSYCTILKTCWYINNTKAKLKWTKTCVFEQTLNHLEI